MTVICSLDRQSGTAIIANRESLGKKVEICHKLPDREYRYRPVARVMRGNSKEKTLHKEGLRLAGGEGGIRTLDPGFARMRP